MFKNIRQLASDSIIYGISGIITRFISIVLIPIYTKIFNPLDYGIINLVTTTFVLISIFVVLGLDNAVAVWYWDKEEEYDRRTSFSSWFWTQFGLSLIILIVILLTSGFLSKKILGDTSLGYLLVLAALNLPLTAFTLLFSSWLRIKRNPKGVVIFSLSNSVLTICLSIYLVVFLRTGIKGVFLAQLISNFLCALVVIRLMAKVISPRYFKFARMKEMIKYSGPLIPAILSFWIMNSAGVYFVNHYSSKADVGLYQIGSSMAAVCNIIFWAFLQAWSPFAMSIHKNEDAPGLFSLVFDLYCALGSMLVLFIFLFSPEILLVFTTPAYFDAAIVSGILSINIFIANIPQITSIGSAIKKTNLPYLAGVVIGSAISVLLYFLLIPHLGKEGAALSTLVGSIVLSVFVTYKSQLLYYIPYNIKKNGVLLSIMAILIIGSFFIPYSGLITRFTIKLIFLLTFTGIVVYLNRQIVARFKRRLFFR